MKIELFDRDLGDFQVAEDLKSGKIHMVFAAVNALTFFNAFAVENRYQETAKGITTDQATQLCKIVNERNETGTLYPKLNVSILPLTKYENRNDWENEYLMKKNILDVFKANTDYVKNEIIIFAFEERHDFNNRLAVKALDTISKEYFDNGLLKKIYYIKG